MWGGGLALALALDDPRRRFPLFAAAMVASALGALGASSALPRDRSRPHGGSAEGGALTGPLIALVVAALAARVWALLLPPAYSEDVFRYVYEGRLTQLYGPLFPFMHPPAEGPALGVPPELLDATWLRVNHASIPTIYPPLSQLVFTAGAALGDLLGGRHLVALKALLVGAELLAVAAVARVSRRAGLLMLTCPLLIVEVAREGHGDALTVLGLALGAAALAQPEVRGAAQAVRRAAVGFALAALAKLVGVAPLLVLLLPRPSTSGAAEPAAALTLTARARALAPGLALLSLTALPYLAGGTTALRSYSTAWRSGDGAFTLILWVVQAAMGGDWTRVADVTLTAHQVSRALTLVGLVASAALLLPRAPRTLDKAGISLLLVLLWSPSVHVWYVLWLLPFWALGTWGAGAMGVMLVLAPLLHHPGWLALTTDTWTDVPWVRALVHVPTWALLVRRARVV